MPSYHFAALETDLSLLLEVLAPMGGKPFNSSLDLAQAPERLLIEFPGMGPTVFFPENLNPELYKADTPARQKSVALAASHQARNPGSKTIDYDNSPVAILHLPVRMGRHLLRETVLTFPTSNLKKRFPELGRISNTVGRWLKGHPKIYDSRQNHILESLGKHVLQHHQLLKYDESESKWSPPSLLGYEGLELAVFGLPLAMGALLGGSCLVSRTLPRSILKTRIEQITRQLRLLGWEGDKAFELELAS